MSEIAAEDAQPVSAEIRDKLLEPFITATRAALGEMASTEVIVRAVRRSPGHHALRDVSAVVGLTSATVGSLVLSFSERTAAALAERMLADVSVQVDEQLIRDCVGEIGNVVAGQAKALMAGTPYHFTFSLPRVVIGVNSLEPTPGPDCLFIALYCDQGEFTLRLFLKP